MGRMFARKCELIKQGIANLANVIGCRDDIMVYLIHAGLNESMAFYDRGASVSGLWNKIDDEERETYIVMMCVKTMSREWYIDSCSKIKYMF